jgi:hypothetical protein
MLESIGKLASRALTAPFKGTPPAAEAPAVPPTPTKPAVATDRAHGLAGREQLAAFAQPVDPRAEFREQAQAMLAGMDVLTRVEAERMLAAMTRDLNPGESLGEFRAQLKTMLNKFKQFVDGKQEEQRHVRAEVDAQWLLFYQSLERYLNRLATLAKVEADVLDRRQKESKSEAVYSERLLVAAAATQAPEQQVTLLSAQLSRKL